MSESGVEKKMLSKYFAAHTMYKLKNLNIIKHN